MQQKQIVCFLLLAYFFVIVTLSPGISWLVVGINNLNDDCVENIDGLDLAEWLTVIGAVQTFHSVLILLAVSCNACECDGGPCRLAEFWHWCHPCGSFRAGCDTLFWHLYWIVNVVFMFAWSIAGSVELGEDDACRHNNDQLFHFCIWAVVFGYIFAILNAISGCYLIVIEPRSKTDSENDSQ